MRRLPALGLVSLLALAVAVAAASATRAPRVDFARLPGLQKGPAPWSNGSATLDRRVRLLGLDAMTQEQLAFHIHQHLDLWVNGRKLPIPAEIGIDRYTFQPFITELHTHDTTGVLHVESAKRVPYTLGQLFGEWGVRLDRSHVGRYGGTVRWWVNGKERSGDPASLVLAPHQEIAVALGPPPKHVPRTYAFAPGE